LGFFINNHTNDIISASIKIFSLAIENWSIQYNCQCALITCSWNEYSSILGSFH